MQMAGLGQAQCLTLPESCLWLRLLMAAWDVCKSNYCTRKQYSPKHSSSFQQFSKTFWSLSLSYLSASVDPCSIHLLYISIHLYTSIHSLSKKFSWQAFSTFRVSQEKTPLLISFEPASVSFVWQHHCIFSSVIPQPEALPQFFVILTTFLCTFPT